MRPAKKTSNRYLHAKNLAFIHLKLHFMQNLKKTAHSIFCRLDKLENLEFFFKETIIILNSTVFLTLLNGL